MTDYKNTEEFKEIFEGYQNIENQQVRMMAACKQFYKKYPDQKIKKVKQARKNDKNIETLIDKFGVEKLNILIEHSTDKESYNVNFATGKITKKRKLKSKSPEKLDDLESIEEVNQ